MRNAEKALENEIAGVAEACFSHLVQNPAELQRFMTETGYTAETIGEAVGSRALAVGMIEYFVRSEPLLLALSANAGLDPGRVATLWRRLNPES